MLIVRGHTVDPSVRGAALAIGNFDGAHRGHRALIDAAVAAAGSGLGGVLLFEPHPREFFASGTPHFRLTPLALKLEELAALGAQVAVVLTFDGALASMSADEFMSQVLIRNLALRHVVVGHDFRFGKDRQGDAHALSARGARDGFGTTIIQPVRVGDVIVSSTAIRQALASGDVAKATLLRGRPWVVRGVVHGGAQRGTGMGYPTANVTLARGTDLAHGIYAVRVRIGNEWHLGASYLGTRPTFDNGAPVLETFLLDFDGNLYGQAIDIAFIARIRADRAFDTTDALVQQMDRDVAAVRAVLAG